MQVKEILRVKGNRLLSIEPSGRAADAVAAHGDAPLVDFFGKRARIQKPFQIAPHG